MKLGTISHLACGVAVMCMNNYRAYQGGVGLDGGGGGESIERDRGVEREEDGETETEIYYARIKVGGGGGGTRVVEIRGDGERGLWGERGGGPRWRESWGWR